MATLLHLLAFRLPACDLRSDLLDVAAASSQIDQLRDRPGDLREHEIRRERHVSEIRVDGAQDLAAASDRLFGAVRRLDAYGGALDPSPQRIEMDANESFLLRDLVTTCKTAVDAATAAD